MYDGFAFRLMQHDECDVDDEMVKVRRRKSENVI